MTRPDPLIGSVIAGRYEIVRVIGRGGMGTIYEVRNTRLGRSFALKTLASGAEPEVLARFRREAEIVAKLRHPNILEVVDWETLDDGSPCMVMEYLTGEDLAERLKITGPLPWPDLARIADQTLAALTVAHRAGVIHRDLKPQNIFLASDDNGDERVKLLDFGISKLRDARTFTTTDAKVMGTPAYMPPEQAEGRQDDVGPASDVWAMGTILYEMTAGKVAYDGPNMPAILYKVCHGRPVPLRELRPDAPEQLVTLIDRALTIAIANRLDSVERMRAELRGALGDLAGVSWPEPLRARTGPMTAEKRITGTAPSVLAPSLDLTLPSSGVPVRGSSRTIDTGPVAIAATIGPASGDPAVAHTALTKAVSPAAPAAVLTTAQTSIAPATRKRWALAAALASVTVVAGVGALVATRSSHRATPPAAPAPAPIEQPTPAPAPAPAPVATPPVPVRSAKVDVTIDSTPSGADVFRLPSEAKVGVTPWTTSLDRTDGTALFLVKKRGYEDARTELDLRQGGSAKLALKKVGTSGGGKPSATGTTTSAAPTGSGRKKGEPVDPFATGKGS